ncbi:Putative papain-like cysteine peptidase [Chryseobacterium oleae]|uniref:Putative papain-like cysteine peptidase n=1 Tax=Chryseobacterium oleae TaxID=491207 RepID=A0A1I5C883_CHROL|nr:DUF1796 family putative cysteine peptidase [Chryseobacterium oleae]SFN83213.1 Putative papain-like cysteine peptidase [Chryseobacterium oleae]
MKLPILFIPKTRYKYFLLIKRNYTSEKYIIPIGKDCHPAHTLKILNIRIQSLPYDWLRLKSILGLKIVRENIQDRFMFFLDDLRKNERGNTYAKKYPDTEFTHSKAVINDLKLRKTFEKRCSLCMHIIENQSVAYLYTFGINDFKTSEDVDFFCETVYDFTKILKTKDSLHMYIRFDEHITNEEICQALLTRIKKIPKVHITTYIRQKEKFGIWGNEKEYPKLYKRLNLPIRQVFPKFYLINDK